jgi:hypothetical protein
MVKLMVWGRNAVVGTAYEDMNPYDQATDQAALFATATALDYSSTSTDDLGVGATPGTGARTVQAIGVDASFNAVTETVLLNGQTKVVGTQAFKCVHEVRVATAGSGRTNAGIIHVVKSGTGGTYTTGTPGTLTSAIAKILAGAGSVTTGNFCVPVGYTVKPESLLIGASVHPGTMRILSEKGSVMATEVEINFGLGAWSLDLSKLPVAWTEKTYLRLQTLAASAGGIHSAAMSLKRVTP